MDSSRVWRGIVDLSRGVSIGIMLKFERDDALELALSPRVSGLAFKFSRTSGGEVKQRALESSNVKWWMRPVTISISYTATQHRLSHRETSSKMPTFGSKKFRSSSYNNTLPARYRAALAKHPFALFGLPFVGTMLLGSFFLTPATALRYERHDRKVKTMTEDEKLGIGKDRRRIDMKEEYYVSFFGCFGEEVLFRWGTSADC